MVNFQQRTRHFSHNIKINNIIFKIEKIHTCDIKKTKASASKRNIYMYSLMSLSNKSLDWNEALG